MDLFRVVASVLGNLVDYHAPVVAVLAIRPRVLQLFNGNLNACLLYTSKPEMFAAKLWC